VTGQYCKKIRGKLLQDLYGNDFLAPSFGILMGVRIEKIFVQWL
jgi:hypothetical protein